jgi:hypothetical protein
LTLWVYFGLCGMKKNEKIRPIANGPKINDLAFIPNTPKKKVLKIISKLSTWFKLVYFSHSSHAACNTPFLTIKCCMNVICFVSWWYVGMCNTLEKVMKKIIFWSLSCLDNLDVYEVLLSSKRFSWNALQLP